MSENHYVVRCVSTSLPMLMSPNVAIVFGRPEKVVSYGSLASVMTGLCDVVVMYALKRVSRRTIDVQSVI